MPRFPPPPPPPQIVPSCIRGIWTTSSEVEPSGATPELSLLTRYLSSPRQFRNAT
ncbi:hypothetical protein CGRA01v4_01063 [Colletotrichum graminicola]|nr:hypothetical protein CGRA01v4_01063 [Colletotrichum graminicola]